MLVRALDKGRRLKMQGRSELPNNQEQKKSNDFGRQRLWVKR
jgi:hypothetical protein